MELSHLKKVPRKEPQQKATPAISKSKLTADSLASLFLEVVSKASQQMRHELRASRHEALSVPQFRVLINLRPGPSTTKDLAEVIGVGVPSMSRMLHSLEREGLIVRKLDKVDRRKSRVEITHKGQLHLERGRQLAQCALDEKLKALGSKKCADLKSGLLILREFYNAESI